jgi:glutathione synthase/RimK-type ligase-like ATP-grasp enzyme
MFYENKTLQYDILRTLGFPVIETFISHDFDEAMEWIRDAHYPFVSKTIPGSGSQGVAKISSRLQAELLIRRAFSTGKPTYWPGFRQKNYVHFQRYVENSGFDLRIIIIDREHIYGYYRTVPQGDFRASGVGPVVYGELPPEVIRTAYIVSEALCFPLVALDFIIDSATNRPYIVEASIFILVDRDFELIVEGIPGRYILDPASGQIKFEAGRYWLPELAMRRFLELSLEPSSMPTPLKIA